MQTKNCSISITYEKKHICVKKKHFNKPSLRLYLQNHVNPNTCFKHILQHSTYQRLQRTEEGNSCVFFSPGVVNVRMRGVNSRLNKASLIFNTNIALPNLCIHSQGVGEG